MQSDVLIGNFLPSCLYVISWQPEKYRHTKAQRQRKKEKYKTRNMNSITPVCRLPTTTNTVHSLKFKKRHKSTESCSYQTSWVNISFFQMHDSICHTMNGTPLHMSKINKRLKVLLLKFLGYFTTRIGKKIKGFLKSTLEKIRHLAIQSHYVTPPNTLRAQRL